MWTFYSNSFIMPNITEWKNCVSEGILPIQKIDNIYVVKEHTTNFKNCLAINKGELVEICHFCKKTINCFVDKDLVCKFSFEKVNKTSYFGWKDEDKSLLTDGLEIPAIALSKNLKSHKHNGWMTNLKMDFNINRIIANLEKINNNFPLYNKIKNDPSTNFYTTRTLFMQYNSADIWSARIKKLLKKLKKLDRNEMKRKILTLEI